MDTEQLQQESQKDEAWGKAMQAIKREEEKEQSHTSKLLEHHLKLTQLERKVAYLQAQLEAAEERRNALRKTLLIFGVGVIYGLVLVLIFSE